MFTDSTYFIGEIALPNVSDNAVNMAQAIGQYEKEILIKVLGYKLYKLLIADCTNYVPATQIYIDLVNGAEFEHEATFGETITLKWEGLKNDSKISLISYYTYYKVVERSTLHLSDIGNMLIDSDSGKRVSPIDKMCNAWYRMRELIGIIPPRFITSLGDNPIPADSLNAPYNDDPSLYNFMYANKADYPDWIFTPIWGINRFGI